jgi:LPS export ABC transporter protein LptC
MDRLARRILVVVGLFVLVVAGTLVAKSRTVRMEASGPAPTRADLSINDVHLQEESSSGGRWQLVAEQASVFDAEGRTALKRVRVRVQEPDRAWTIVGDEGDYFKATNDLEVRHNVVMTSDDGLRIETTVLRWKGGERRLWTDVPVRIYRQGVVIDGTALNVAMADERTAVKGRVRATFDGRREPGS